MKQAVDDKWLNSNQTPSARTLPEPRPSTQATRTSDRAVAPRPAFCSTCRSRTARPAKSREARLCGEKRPSNASKAVSAAGASRQGTGARQHYGSYHRHAADPVHEREHVNGASKRKIVDHHAGGAEQAPRRLSSCTANDFPFWVKSRHLRRNKSCPLDPQKRTCAAHKPMSAKCQKRNDAVRAINIQFRDAREVTIDQRSVEQPRLAQAKLETLTGRSYRRCVKSLGHRHRKFWIDLQGRRKLRLRWLDSWSPNP